MEEGERTVAVVLYQLATVLFGVSSVRLGFGDARVSPKPERTSTKAANTPCVALRIRVRGDAMLVSFIMLGGETGRCTARRRFLETKTETRKKSREGKDEQQKRRDDRSEMVSETRDGRQTCSMRASKSGQLDPSVLDPKTC